MAPFNPTITPHIPADMNQNPVALQALQIAPGVVVPVGGATMIDGSYAVQVVVGTAAPASLSSAALIGAIAMTAAAAQILAANPLRKGHLLTNTGAQIVYLGFDNTVTAATGIPLAVGASISLDLPGVPFTGAIWGICNTALTSTIRGVEYF